jgi:hypothetical protein
LAAFSTGQPAPVAHGSSGFFIERRTVLEPRGQ